MAALPTEATVWDWSVSLLGFASSTLLEIAACILVTCTVASLRDRVESLERFASLREYMKERRLLLGQLPDYFYLRV